MSFFGHISFQDVILPRLQISRFSPARQKLVASCKRRITPPFPIQQSGMQSLAISSWFQASAPAHLHH